MEARFKIIRRAVKEIEDGMYVKLLFENRNSVNPQERV